MNNLDRLYNLLPVVYRQTDAEQGYPLRALLQVISEQVDVVEKNISQLYENWFIETCEDWVVPYIGELIGYRIVHDAGEPGDVSTKQGRQQNKILIPRQEIANTIAYRRRKGTLALIELLANSVAGWPARAVQFYELLCWTQNISHLNLQRGGTTDIRDVHALDLINGPFEKNAHTVDIRRPNSHRTTGRYNIPSIGAFIWRLKSYSVGWTNLEANDWNSHIGISQAYCVEEEGPECYTFNVLGNDTPLYNRPQAETEPTHIAEELNLPTPIRRAAFEAEDHTASPDYYGKGKSLLIWAPDWPKKNAEQPIPASSIIPADLSQWHYQPERNKIAVDPVTGRIVFPPRQLPKQGVAVYYNYAFSADIGGGEYYREILEPVNSNHYDVGGNKALKTINEALKLWGEHKKAILAQGKEKPQSISAVIEITDSGVYTEALNVTLDENESLQIRAANRRRPVIRLLDYMADRPDVLSVKGHAGSRFTLDGLLIMGRGLQVSGPDVDSESKHVHRYDDLCDVTIRHTTLVPGWSLHCDCEPKRPSEPSLELVNTSACVKIEHSIIGSIRVIVDEVRSDPLVIKIRDSIWDATSIERELLSAPDSVIAHAALTILRTTAIGQILTHQINLGENCIFMGMIQVARRLVGCLRFSYVSPESRTPRRYECQPDLVIKTVKDDKNISEAKKTEEMRLEAERVKPHFNSIRFGTPTYCQLSEASADEIKRGADDESEMGAFHDLYQPQRAANLRARLEEYTPAGMDVGIIYAS